MQELDFSCDQSINEAFEEIHYNFCQDIEEGVEREIEQFLNNVLVIDANRQIGANWYKRTVERMDYRAGYRPRTVITPKGMYHLKVPRARNISLRFSVFNRYERLWEKVNDMLRDIFMAGCSTRRTGEVLEVLLGTRVSAQTVSRAVEKLTPMVEAYHRRRLEDKYQILLLDGVTQSVRTGSGKASKKLILVAYGITCGGHRELIDYVVSPSESEPAWFGFLNRMFNRGLEGDKLKLIVSDGGAGLIKTLAYVYPHVGHQRCWAHKLRNVADKVNQADRRRVVSGAKKIYLAPDRKTARRAFNRWSDRWIDQYPKAVRCIEKDLDTLLTFYDYPAGMREYLRTTNLIERSFKEVRRRTRNIGCFCNVKSCDRLTYALFTYLNAKWESTPLLHFAHNT